MGTCGSGRRIQASIKKHGIENHTKEILEYCEDRDSLAKREALLVNEELLQDEKCLNLALGGFGYWDQHNIDPSNKKYRQLGAKRMNEVLWKDDAFRNRHSDKLKLQHSKGEIKTVWSKGSTFDRTGMITSNEVKQKIGLANSVSQKGTRNSQHGTCWVTNTITFENQKINKNLLDEFLNVNPTWKKGRKIKLV
jgi:uncharacterized protein YciI